MISISPLRRGLGLIRFLLGTVVLAAILANLYGIYANWPGDADGDGKADGLTWRPLDAAWWTNTRNSARSDLAQAREKMLGEGGVIDDMKDWYKRQSSSTSDGNDQPAASPQPETPEPPAAPGTPAPIKQLVSSEPALDPAAVSKEPTLHLEDRIVAAGERFQEGLILLEDGLRGDDPSQQAEAEQRFRKVGFLLDGVAEEYAKREPHDPELLTFAKGLGERNQRILSQAFPK